MKNDVDAVEMCQHLLEIGFIDQCQKPAAAADKADAGTGTGTGTGGRDSELSGLDLCGTAQTRNLFNNGTNFEFKNDDNTLYRIGDISPNPILVMADDENAGLRRSRRAMTLKNRKVEEMLRPDSMSLFCLSTTNPIRTSAVDVLVNPWFDRIVLSLILISSILLALDEPNVQEGSGMGVFLKYTDLVMTILFLIEMTLKVVGMGFILCSSAYLRNSWNVLDFVIILVSVAGIVLKGVVDLAFLKSLRAMRGLRPLRMVSRAPGMKMVVNAIFIALPACINVVMVVMMCFLVFAIMGSTFFSGLFYYCSGDGDTDKYGLDRVDCVGEYWDAEQGMNKTRVWDLYPSNFDNVKVAMTTLFELSSLEMWPDVMNFGRDVTEVDMHPVKDASLGNALFFVFFIFLGSFFVINLFVGVVM